MGSHRHYFLMPQSNSVVTPKPLVERLAREGWQLETGAFMLDVGDDGAAISSREVNVSLETLFSLDAKLRESQRLLCVLAHNYLPLNLNLCGPLDKLGIQALSHSVKMWERLDTSTRISVENTLAQGANDSAAEAVLIINDPPDDILGRMVRIQNQWLVDLTVTGYQVDPCAIWLKDLSVVPTMRGPVPLGERRSVYDVYVETR